MYTIKNEVLAGIIMFKLNKLENLFTREELDSITRLSINNNDIIGNFVDIDLKELKFFPNLTELELFSFEIDENDFIVFKSLSSLSKLVFNRCIINDGNMLGELSIRELSFFVTFIGDYSFLKFMINITKLEIVGELVFDLSNIVELENLIELRLSNSNIENIDILNRFTKLESLSIDGINIINIDFLTSFNNLKSLSLDEEQFNCNKETIKLLQLKDISIYIDNSILDGDRFEI